MVISEKQNRLKMSVDNAIDNLYALLGFQRLQTQWFKISAWFLISPNIIRENEKS